ncbi:MAG: cyclic nucleotide-binding domain-containing protein [Nitrospiraceae bacterium]
MNVGTLLFKLGLTGLGIVLGLVALVYFARRRQKGIPILVVVVLVGTSLLASTLLLFSSGVIAPLPSRTRAWLEFTTYLGVSFVLLKLVDLLIIGDHLIDRKGAYIPDVLRTVFLFVGLTVAVLVILRLVMNINVIALVALPTVATAVVGVALRDTFVRFFAGISLGKMMRVGDWVSVMDKEGVVTDIGFGHVTLRTRDNDYVALPNNNVIQTGLINYSRPTTAHGCHVLVEAAYRTPPAQVRAVLGDAASAVGGVLTEPAPEVMVEAFRDSGIQYRLQFWIEDYSRHQLVESEVMTYVWSAFQRNGIEIPFPQRVVQTLMQQEGVAVMRRQTDQIVAHLAKVDFFAILDPQQIESLASEARVQEFLPGEQVVRQGEPGEELFIMLDGTAEVCVHQAGRSSTVASLQRGQFFGEMSLLTGEPRSATVVATTPLRVLSIGKQALSRVVQKDGDLVGRISGVVAQRQVEMAATKERLSRESAAVTLGSQKHSLMERIQQFLWGRTHR